MSFRSKDPTFVYLVLCAGWPLFFTMLAVTNLVYQVQVAHLDPLRLLLVGSVVELTCLVFQVPTGLFADAFSRRWATSRERIAFISAGSNARSMAMTSPVAFI